MRYSQRFVVVAAFFVTALVVSNIIAVKLVEVSGRVFPAGLVIFPLAYLLGDVLTEVYGVRAARRVIWLGFACNLVALGAIQAAIHLPAADFWEENEGAYEQILGTTWRLFVASLAAYVVGELANAYVLAFMKGATGGRFLWTRTIGSATNSRPRVSSASASCRRSISERSSDSRARARTNRSRRTRNSRFPCAVATTRDRKSTRLNSSHVKLSYAV